MGEHNLWHLRIVGEAVELRRVGRVGRVRLVRLVKGVRLGRASPITSPRPFGH